MVSDLRFGVSRSHGGLRLQEGAHRFAACLGAALGAKVRVTIAGDYDRLLAGVLFGGIEVAWMPPLVHARATDGGAHLAAVSERSGAIGYRSAILVREKSLFRSLAELRGRRAAWVEQSSVAGYLFPRLYLRAAGIDPAADMSSERFCGSTAQACAAVANDEADLCACFVTEAAGRGLDTALADVRRNVGRAADHLRVLFITDRIPPDGIVLGAPLPQDERAEVRKALLGLHEQPSGLAALRTLLQAERLAPVNEEVQQILNGLRALT